MTVAKVGDNMTLFLCKKVSLWYNLGSNYLSQKTMKQKIRLLANFLLHRLWLVVSTFIFFRLSAQGLAAPLEFDPGGQIGTTLGLGTADFESTVIGLTQWVLSLLGLVGVVMMIIGGYIYLTAGGNEDKVDQAKRLIKNALVGLILVLLSYAIASFVFDKIQEASGLTLL